MVIRKRTQGSGHANPVRLDLRYLSAIALGCGFFSGCGSVQEHLSQTPYARTAIVKQSRLPDQGWLHFSARRVENQLEARLQSVQMCLVGLRTTQGVEITHHRSSRSTTPLWIAFGTLTATTIVGGAAVSASECKDGSQDCAHSPARLLPFMTGVAAAAVGIALVANLDRASDSTDRVESPPTETQRVEVCARQPLAGAVVEVVLDSGLRGRATTNDKGEAAIALRGVDPTGELAVQFWIEHSPLPRVSLSTQWRQRLLVGQR